MITQKLEKERSAFRCIRLLDTHTIRLVSVVLVVLCRNGERNHVSMPSNLYPTFDHSNHNHTPESKRLTQVHCKKSKPLAFYVCEQEEEHDALL